MALLLRKPGASLIHHSDQGSQYTDGTYRALQTDHGIRASMNGVGSWYADASSESFFGMLKSDLIHHCLYATCAEARTDVFCYIESFHNLQRRHSGLGYLSPDAHEQLLYRQERSFA